MLKFFRIFLLFLTPFFLLACSSAPTPKVDQNGLRSRANQAFEPPQNPTIKPVRSKKTPSNQPLSSDQQLGQNTTSASSTVTCQSLDCLDQTSFFAAEGIGTNERSAQEDATARLSARIESQIESVVRSSYSENDQGSQSNNSIERSVKTTFQYGELIRFLPSRSTGSEVIVVAYFNKRDYQARLKRDYGNALEDVRFQLQDAVAANTAPNTFVQAWRAVQEPLVKYQRYIQLDQAVMGSLSPEAKEVNQLIESAERLRRRMLSRAQLVITYSANTSNELKGGLSSLLQEVMNTWQLRSRVGDVCPQGGHQLSVETAKSTSTHIATGTPMTQLKWSIAVLSCPDKATISRAQLPALTGVERANKSSDVALVDEINRLKQFLTKGSKARNQQLAKKLNGLSTGLYQVLSDSFPVSAQASSTKQ